MSTLNVTSGDLKVLTRLGGELREIALRERGFAIRHLLSELSKLMGASNAFWVPAVRAQTLPERPGLFTEWRVPSFEILEATESLLRDAREAALRLASGDPDRMTARYARLAGHDRAARPIDFMSRIEWEEDWYVQDHLSKHGFTDQVQGSSLLDRRAEVTIGFWRDGRSRFRDRERDLLLLAATVLRQPLREIALAEGLLGTDGTLTTRERQVLDGLLHGQGEMEIARELRTAVSTVHHQIASVYRKLGVRGRAGLLALWSERR